MTFHLFAAVSHLQFVPWNVCHFSFFSFSFSFAFCSKYLRTFCTHFYCFPFLLLTLFFTLLSEKRIRSSVCFSVCSIIKHCFRIYVTSISFYTKLNNIYFAWSGQFVSALRKMFKATKYHVRKHLSNEDDAKNDGKKASDFRHVMQWVEIRRNITWNERAKKLKNFNPKQKRMDMDTTQMLCIPSIRAAPMNFFFTAENIIVAHRRSNHDHEESFAWMDWTQQQPNRTVFSSFAVPKKNTVDRFCNKHTTTRSLRVFVRRIERNEAMK